MITITPYELEEDRGTVKRGRKNVIRVDIDPAPGCVAFDTREEFNAYWQTRGLIHRQELVVSTDDGVVDEEATEEAIQTHYMAYYDNVKDIAILFKSGLRVVAGQPSPISYGGNLYDVIQSHTTQSDWTPDIVPALFKLIQPPTEEGYPAWVQPTGAHDAYAIGARVTHNGQNWECVQGDASGNNVWEPGVFGWAAI